MAAAVVGQALRALTTIAGIMVLARLVEPAVFGHFALLWSVVIFLDNLRSFGWLEAVVQVPEVAAETFRSLFWRTAALGLGFAGLMALTGPLLELLYGEPGFVAPALGLSLLFLVGGLNLQPQARWRRQMRFTELNVALTVAMAFGVGMSVLVAWRGYGMAALIVMHVAREAFLTIWLLACQRRDPFRWSWAPLPEVFGRYTRDLLVQRLVSVHTLRLDQFLLGAIAPAALLGIYNRMFTLVEMPTRNLRIAVGEVSHASLSRLQSYPPRQARYFLRLLQVLAWLWLPVVAVVLAAGESVIRVALGPGWSVGLPYLQLLTLAATGFLFWYACMWLDLAQGATRRTRNWALVQAAVVFALIGLGALHSPLALVAGYSAGCFALMLARLHRMLARLRPHAPEAGWKRMIAPTLCAAVVGAVFALVEQATDFPDLYQLVLSTLLAGGLLAAWLLRSPRARAELKAWRELLARKGATP